MNSIHCNPFGLCVSLTTMKSYTHTHTVPEKRSNRKSNNVKLMWCVCTFQCTLQMYARLNVVFFSIWRSYLLCFVLHCCLYFARLFGFLMTEMLEMRMCFFQMDTHINMYIMQCYGSCSFVRTFISWIIRNIHSARSLCACVCAASNRSIIMYMYDIYKVVLNANESFQ